MTDRGDRADRSGVIRDAVIHLTNEQPLLADLLETPSPGDATLICTNLRTMNGQRPVFIDDVDSVFVFPLVHVRFVEIPPRARGELEPAGGDAATASGAREAGDEAEADLEIDQDFLRRVREV